MFALLEKRSGIGDAALFVDDADELSVDDADDGAAIDSVVIVGGGVGITMFG